MLARGPLNEWGFDEDIPAQMSQRNDGKWDLEIMASWPTYMQVNIFGYDDYYYGDIDGNGLPQNTAARTTSTSPRRRSPIWPGPSSSTTRR